MIDSVKGKKKILLIGPCNNKKNPSKTGGVIVLFENLLSYCKEHRIDYYIIDTNKANYRNLPIALFSIVTNILLKTKKSSSVSLHGTANDYLFIAPWTILVSKLFHKHITLRKFAGNFNELYDNSCFFVRCIYKMVLSNVDCTFWETKYLVEFGKSFNSRSIWFPNVRKAPSFLPVAKNYQKRFVFMSHVTKEKGIDELLSAFALLDTSYSLDIYGELFNYKASDLQTKNVFYKTALSSDCVLSTLADYDVLLLPSVCEGYPGIVIESLSLGIPVIVSDVGGLPEMVKNNYNGFMVPAHDSEALLNAVVRMSSVNYSQLSQNAVNSFMEFDSELVYKKIFKFI